ncbi:hypothetical protein LZD49_18450 [Dyadobacter sp. CY261]|uniref:hypothetical protein n=1 Tax=Dyadobacter sp. CY261 TaxID=2907203 RepID=UPI001F1600F4|nr:hypothetical protein [Dyadobacter sp. CY261]MCF0072469.1 hypothetical protein [Dyadobacter sp. CY261]
MAIVFNNPLDDPTLIGYSKYSRFRVGNLIYISGLHGNVGIHIPGRILTIGSDEDPFLVEIESLATGATAFVKPSVPGIFGTRVLYPENLGFVTSADDRHSYSDGITTLSGSGFQNFGVTDAVSGRLIYDKREVYDILSERTRIQGIEFIHELQNLYAEEFPDKTLDLSYYIERSLNVLAKSKERIDAGEKVW